MTRPTSPFRRLALPLLPGLLAVSTAAILLHPASARQTQDDLFLDRLDVRLVLVDVVVEDRDGEPILDLEAGDFRVFEDGRPVELESFTPPGAPTSRREAGPRPTADAAASPPVTGRTVVMLDELHLHPSHRNRVLARARRALADRMDGTEQVLLARFDGQLRIIEPFTNDRATILDALDAEADVRRIPIRTAWNETERTLKYLADLQAQNTDPRDRSASGPAGRPESGDPCVQNGHIARRHAQEMHDLATQSLTGLFQLVGSLARSDGRKALIHVSDGLPLTPGTAVYDFAAELCDGTGAIQDLADAIDTSLLGLGENTRWDPKKAQMELAEFEMTREWNQLAALANAKQVSIYPLQASGLRGSRSAQVDSTRIGMNSEFSARVDIENSMHLVADQTGGTVILNTNEFDVGIREVMSESARTYRLSYVPPSPGDGAEHSIAVEVDRPGVRLRHRRSYLDQTAEQRLADAVVATLLHGETDNPLAAQLDVAAGDPPTERGAHVVQLSLTLPLESLTTLSRQGRRAGRFTVLVAAREGGGRFTPVGRRVFPVELPADGDGETEEASSYVYEIAIPLRGGGATVAVAVRDDVTGNVSFLRREIDLPVS